LRAPTRNLFRALAFSLVPLFYSILAWLVFVTNQFFVFLTVIAGSDPQSVFLQLVASAAADTNRAGKSINQQIFAKPKISIAY
jgi:hypothetical protein